MTSFERIKEYCELESEDLCSKRVKIDDKWPTHGEIKFENFSLRYAPDSEPVLHDLSFEINSGEKVGIVGRTGAGKSSIVQALFRMAYSTNGVIKIDDVDIDFLKLSDLRSRLSIIPQEPTLFSGTIRFNLDPSNQMSDENLWDALEKVELKSTVSNMTGGLDAKLEKMGSNLSVGQKQLLCVARAILKNTKILIVDEATANADFQTDKKIQKAIQAFFQDSTVLTIAHRLNTITECNRIMCLNSGEIIVFDKTASLIKNERSKMKEIYNEVET